MSETFDKWFQGYERMNDRKDDNEYKAMQKNRLEIVYERKEYELFELEWLYLMWYM